MCKKHLHSGSRRRRLQNMSLLEEIQGKIAAGRFEFSEHATERSIRRDISVQELRDAIVRGEVIEDYPDDKYGPSCLIFGKTRHGRPLHVQMSYPTRPLLKVITLYEPDPERWIDYRTRRPSLRPTPKNIS